MPKLKIDLDGVAKTVEVPMGKRLVNALEEHVMKVGVPPIRRRRAPDGEFDAIGGRRRQVHLILSVITAQVDVQGDREIRFPIE